MPSRPDGEPHQARGDAGGELLLGGQLRVRGRRGVDDQAADVADVGHVAVQLQRLHELLAGLAAAVQLEGEHRAGARGARTSAAPRASGTRAGPGTMAMIQVAVLLLRRLREGDGPPLATTPSPVAWLVRVTFVAGWVVLYLGTVVTGSGPHAGDPKPAGTVWTRGVSQLHADVVLLVVGLTVATGSPCAPSGRRGRCAGRAALVSGSRWSARGGGLRAVLHRAAGGAGRPPPARVRARRGGDGVAPGRRPRQARCLSPVRTRHRRAGEPGRLAQPPELRGERRRGPVRVEPARVRQHPEPGSRPPAPPAPPPRPRAGRTRSDRQRARGRPNRGPESAHLRLQDLPPGAISSRPTARRPGRWPRRRCW